MFNHKKVVQMLNFFAQRAKEIRVPLYKTNALKLVYFADKKHLRDYVRTISGDSYIAKQMGPVANTVCDLIEAQAGGEEERSEAVQYADEFISSKRRRILTARKKIFTTGIEILPKKEVDERCLSETDMSVLQFIWDTYKSFLQSNKKNLWEETHKYPEGKKFETNGGKWEEIQEQEMISTTDDGESDMLGEVDSATLKDVQDVYMEKQEGIQALMA